MLFGTPDATGFLYWGWWASATDRERAGQRRPRDANWTTLTPVGVALESVARQLDTDLTTTVNADGTIDFTGFYGDYELTIDGQTYDLSHSPKATSLSSLVIAPGDYNADGIVDAARLHRLARHASARPAICGPTATAMK